eukprot:TRINITY_DN21470_c2_g2_i1.p1 TRINITY_DN21470_c2_g2~~TRINITY_DN21470_c2_g2_i1.p1  ORF type:complete len:649 (+),score=85.10 TRINITY_DN21470_c2_g2_i1:54-1949(+)
MVDLVRSVPPLPQTERGKFCCIESDSAGERVLYCNGNGVLWRTIAPLAEGKGAERPEHFLYWTGHSKRTTSVAMSPNGQWVASGDVTGLLRVWGAKGDNVQKNEFRLWDGAILDVQWSGDSTRIVACGEGKEVRAVAILADTGSKTGEVSGHTKAINSISFRSQRPFRVITGGEDMLVAVHAGPPFKFDKSHTNHTNFVNSVRYSPDGEWAASAGSDSNVCLYEGKSGDLVKEFAKPDGITGSLWALSWSPDSKRIATAGGDKMLRIWDRESGAQVCAVKVGSGQLEDMQVGLVWGSGTCITSVCLDGRLLIWDVAADGSVTLKSSTEGTQCALASVGCDRKAGLILQAGSDGVVAVTPTEGQTWVARVGKGVRQILTHSSAWKGESEAVIISNDDSVRRLSLDKKELGKPVAVGEGSVGAGWADAAETNLLVVTSKSNLICLSPGGVAWSKSGLFPRAPTTMASCAQTSLMAVGVDKPDGLVGGVMSQQYDIHLFSTAGGAADNVVAKGVLSEHKSEVSAMSFSDDGKLLVSGDATGRSYVWDVTQDPPVKLGDYGGHTARITSLEWLPGNKSFVSASLDQNVKVWTVEDKKSATAKPHRGGANGVAALGPDGTFASVGSDGFMLIQKVK